MVTKYTAASEKCSEAVKIGLGLDTAGEGFEEVLTEAVSALGQKLTYASEKEMKELLTRESLWDAFIGGAVMGNVSGSGKAVTGKNLTGWDGREVVREATGPSVTVGGKKYLLLGYDAKGVPVYEDARKIQEQEEAARQEVSGDRGQGNNPTNKNAGNSLEKLSKSAIMELPQALEFDVGEDVNNFFYYDNKKGGRMVKQDSQYGKWKTGLTKDSEGAIWSYTGIDSKEINDYLRKKHGWDMINGEKVEYKIRQLDEAIASFVLTDNIVVQRGASGSSLDVLFDGSVKERSDLIGRQYRDDGFMSATTLMGNPVATTKPVVFTIHIPAGKGRGAYINEFGGEFEDAEYEFLIRRGASFTITDISEDSELGKIYVKMVMDVE